ncbi:MAG: peptidase dimerization domain-containing protein, partial [Halieaceae bacterium]|nr:peptidase dimerization domain-containing protein [Halieaceae bacterium]
IKITVNGVQTHGSSPWKGVDPIVVSAQIINALQTIPSRQLDVTVAPAVLTIGKISGGLRGIIIPDSVEKKVVFLGMNPGPWGMMQSGVPWLKLCCIRAPRAPQPIPAGTKRPANSFSVSDYAIWPDCSTSRRRVSSKPIPVAKATTLGRPRRPLPP